MRIDKRNRKGKIYRKILYIALGLSIVTFGVIWIWDVWNKVPSNIHVRAGKEQGLEFYVPATAVIYKNQEQGLVNVNLNQDIFVMT